MTKLEQRINDLEKRITILESQRPIINVYPYSQPQIPNYQPNVSPYWQPYNQSICGTSDLKKSNFFA